MANLLTSNILNQITNAMYDLEDTFAVHTFELLRPDALTDKFDNNTTYNNRITLKCVTSPRTRVDESDSMLFDDLGTTPKQQITFYVFKREVQSKGLYVNGKLLIEEEDQVIFNGDQYYINQLSDVGFFVASGEVIKIRVTKKID